MRMVKLYGVIAWLVVAVLASAGAAADERIRTLAIWDFDNASFMDMEKSDYLSRVLPELLLNNLAGIQGLKVVERVHLRETMEEMKLGSSQLAADDSKIHLGKVLGAREMVFGGYMLVGSRLRVDVRVVDTETSVTRYAGQFTANIETLMPDLEKLARELSGKMGYGEPAVTALKEDSAILRLYNEGLAKMDSQDYGGAVEKFTEILERDPTFKLAEKQIGLALERMSRS